MGRSSRYQSNKSYKQGKNKRNTIFTNPKKPPKFLTEDMERYSYIAGEPDPWITGRRTFLIILLLLSLAVFLFLHSA